MTIKKSLNVVLCWHMHQSKDRDLCTEESQQPWIFLHVIKDYIDMVVHLEKNPAARAVINFTPILLEQIDGYAKQIKAYINNDKTLSNPLLVALVSQKLPTNTEQRIFLIKVCLRINKPQVIKRFSAYMRLADISSWIIKNPEGDSYLNNQYLIDLLVWYHLVSLGETIQYENNCIKKLIDKAKNFTLQDRRDLLSVIGELLASLIKRYQLLALQQRIELSMTPFSHPIMPLLLNKNFVKKPLIDSKLSVLKTYPNGDERMDWHLHQGLRIFEYYFGFKPQGCWPAEGSLSTETISLLDTFDFKWTASGSNLIKQSINIKKNHLKNIPNLSSSDVFNKEHLYQSYRLNDHNIHCFFCDDELSKLITYTYSDWHADDAVDDFISRLENIANRPETTDNSVVSIILDDAQTLDHYPQNAYYFLDALYQRFGKHPSLKLTTYNKCINDSSEILPPLAYDSWIYGAFSTWTDSTKKRHTWDILCNAKSCFDQVVKNKWLDSSELKKAEKQLAICECSDWFWYSNSNDSADTITDIDNLYCLQITYLYQLLNQTPPAYLSDLLVINSHE
jgi:alpha-amylase/alpha-mannosidase (GH57 family)